MAMMTNNMVAFLQGFKLTSKVFMVVLLPGLILSVTGCSEKIELNLNDTNSRLVVEASVSSDADMHHVILTRTASFFSNETAPRVSGAHVSISDGTNYWSMHEEATGFYVPAEEFAVEAGLEYHLSIEFEGLEYNASSLMPNVPGIDSLTLQAHPWSNESRQLVIHFQDPVETRDFYMWKVYVNGEDMTTPIDMVRFIDDEIVNGQYLSLPFYTFRPDEYIPVPGDTIRVEMHGIVEDYFIFLDAMRRNQGTVGGPFTGPPANIPGNIDNGALGFFKVANISEMVLIADHPLE